MEQELPTLLRVSLMFKYLSAVCFVHFVKLDISIYLVISVYTPSSIVFTLICFVGGSYYVNVIRTYLRILVSNTISLSDDVRVVES